MITKKYLYLLFVLFVALATGRILAQGTSQAMVSGSGSRPWWQHTVIYEIYPRSFADSNNDGIGDLKGIKSKLGYLKDLGIDAIWITPFFPSPQVDFGYDVSDYQNIDPMYGTLADFDALVKEANKHGIRIILDFVLNHTSDQHPWFLDSKSSRTAEHRDWYIWSNGNEGCQPPNNWTSIFGGSAWTLDPTANEYYYHFFYAAQPDLNWRNPAVEKAMLDTTRWWYQRGVAGFRLDAVDALNEDPNLHDEPVLPGENDQGDRFLPYKYQLKLAENQTVLEKLRQVANDYDAVLIGEVFARDIKDLDRYYGVRGDGLQLPMDFMFTNVNKLSAPEFRRTIAGTNSVSGWPTFVLGNHDMARSFDRYGDGLHNDQIARLMAALYLTLRGTPIMYYGEEIGMTTTLPKRKEDIKDPLGRRGWPKEKGRDGERTPMQWSSKSNAGFSKKDPWLRVPSSAKTRNVATEAKDPNSILNFYKKLLALRRTNEALLDGSYTALNQDDANVLSYLRIFEGHAILVALNMSAVPQKAEFDLTREGFPSAGLKSLLATPKSTSRSNVVNLEPFGVFIAQLTK